MPFQACNSPFSAATPRVCSGPQRLLRLLAPRRRLPAAASSSRTDGPLGVTPVTIWSSPACSRVPERNIHPTPSPSRCSTCAKSLRRAGQVRRSPHPTDLARTPNVRLDCVSSPSPASNAAALLPQVRPLPELAAATGRRCALGPPAAPAHGGGRARSHSPDPRSHSPARATAARRRPGRDRGLHPRARACAFLIYLPGIRWASSALWRGCAATRRPAAGGCASAASRRLGRAAPARVGGSAAVWRAPRAAGVRCWCGVKSWELGLVFSLVCARLWGSHLAHRLS